MYRKGFLFPVQFSTKPQKRTVNNDKKQEENSFLFAAFCCKIVSSTEEKEFEVFGEERTDTQK
jgi:hypothetical protein